MKEPTVRSATIPYATPASNDTRVDAWRDGDLLVVPKDGQIPRTCVKCNRPPAPNFAWKRTFHWHHPAIHLLMLVPVVLITGIVKFGPQGTARRGITYALIAFATLFGSLLYGVVVLATRKKTQVAVYLCEIHRLHHQRDVAIGRSIALLSATLLFFGFYIITNHVVFEAFGAISLAPLMLGFVLLIAAISWNLKRTRPLVPKRITANLAWFRGAGRAYLDSLPPM